MQVTELYEKAPYNPEDPNPWLALYLDMSLPLSDEVKAALLSNSGSKSRQFLLPLMRPCAKLSMIAFQVLKIFIPNRFTSSKLLHRLIHWGLRNFVRPDANYLILRHFHIGSEILQFVASNVPGVEIPLNPLRPRNLAALVDDVFLKHDLNIYNFLIRINREMKARGIHLSKQEQLNFDCITDGPFPIDEDSLPRAWLNFLDLESAIEVYMIGDSSYIGLVNNKHPLIPLSTLQAGYRLLLHGLAAECLHATLVQFKRQGRTAPVFAH